jgi:hypothetical protein
MYKRSGLGAGRFLFKQEESNMTNVVREPLLKTVAILDLRPTQMTVGMREVNVKRKRWHDESKKKGEEFLGNHMIPVILGPKGRHYVIDHHHLARALHDEGVKDVAVTVVANLSKLDQDSFWYVMENRDWTHCFVGSRRRPYSDLPKSVDKLIDDPFRSLAGELRRAGGYAKDTTPFSEFLWADFLQRRIKRKTVENNFEHAMEEALELAKSLDADYLPGWCGPVPEE